MSTCKCGCGKELKIETSIFYPGHVNKNRTVSDNTRKILSLKGKGRKHSIESKEKIKKNRTPPINFHHSEEAKRKIGISAIGRLHIISEKTRIKMSEAKRGKIITNETKQKMSIAAIKRIEIQKFNSFPLVPCIGKKEYLCLNELQKHTIYNIIRNDPSYRYIIGRFPDGHIPELKLFIQFDEYSHFKNKDCNIYREDDLRCTLELASLGYIVFRISEKDWDNKEKVINNFKYLIEINNYE